MERPSSKFTDYYRRSSDSSTPNKPDNTPSPLRPTPANLATEPTKLKNTQKSIRTNRILTYKWKKIPVVVILVPIVILAVVTGFILMNGSKDEAEDLAAQLSSYIDLPSDETPSMAEVKDVSQLHDQPFYNLAENGDQVLIYQKAGRALLYRPSTKKVVEYTPVNISPQ